MIAVLVVVVAGVFVAHAASASNAATNSVSGTVSPTNSGNATAGHTCAGATNSTSNPNGTASLGVWP